MTLCARDRFAKIAMLKFDLAQEKKISKALAGKLKKIKTFLERETKKVEVESADWRSKYELQEHAKEEGQTYCSDIFLASWSGRISGEEELLKDLAELMKGVKLC